MARTNHDDDQVYEAIERIRVALEFGSPDTAKAICEKVRRQRQDRTLDRTAQEEDGLTERGG